MLCGFDGNLRCSKASDESRVLKNMSHPEHLIIIWDAARHLLIIWDVARGSWFQWHF